MNHALFVFAIAVILYAHHHIFMVIKLGCYSSELFEFTQCSTPCLQMSVTQLSTASLDVDAAPDADGAADAVAF